MRSVVHRVSDWGIVEGQDIKPDNLLLSESGVVKLSDIVLPKQWNAGDFDDDMEDDFEIDAMAAGLDVDELELMDPDERAEALEEAGLDPDDYDFY